MSQIQLKNLSFSYDKKRNVVKNLTLSIERGEYISVIGRNGSGKSTLSRLLNGLLIPTEGDVFIDGINSKDKNSLFEIRKKVGVVFQNPDNQLVASIVEDDVAFGPENLAIEREEIGKRIDFALKAVDMERYRKSSPERLSGGQKQRVAIAGVLALNPEVLILDESTSMLDPVGREEVLSKVRKINKEEKVTVIAVTHYIEETEFSDKILVLDEGELKYFDTPKEVFSHQKELIELGLDIPKSMQIAKKLKERGINISDNVVTEKDLVESLCKL